MAELNVGLNFTMQHVEILQSFVNMQAGTPNKIVAVYGSPGMCNILGSVRERYRETTPTRSDFHKMLTKIREMGLQYYMTLNSMYMHNIRTNMPIDVRGVYGDEYLDFISEFSQYVDAFIVSHPVLIDRMNESLPDVNVIVSTIMNVHTISQLNWIKLNWPNVIKVCTAVERNRDLEWLIEAARTMPIELLVNEFCSMGGVPCEGLYRQQCYLTQSYDLGENAHKVREKCIEMRNSNPVAWLKNGVILPQWIPYYENIGIHNFKVTGRTHGPLFLQQVVSPYLINKFEGNLLNLWGQLEATLDSEEQDAKQKSAEEHLYIPHTLLGDEPLNCKQDYCGIRCRKCDKAWREFTNGKH